MPSNFLGLEKMQKKLYLCLNMYRILHIEDLPSDAYLIKREVNKFMGPCEYLNVEAKDTFLKALEDFKPHLIISDFCIPGFGWDAALELATIHAPGTPFIIVTGSTSKEIGIECLNAGASDFISKDNIEELGPAIEKILKL